MTHNEPSESGWIGEARSKLAASNRLKDGAWTHFEGTSWSAKDPLGELIIHQDEVRREGKVVWAAYIQANTMLFSPGTTECGGEALLCPDSTFDDNPEELLDMAASFYDLKGTQGHSPGLQHAVNNITDEMYRSFGDRMPPEISRGHNIQRNTIFIPRKHMPGGILADRLFPVVIHPNRRWAFFLPKEFWPDEMRETWENSAEEMKERQGEPSEAPSQSKIPPEVLFTKWVWPASLAAGIVAAALIFLKLWLGNKNKLPLDRMETKEMGIWMAATAIGCAAFTFFLMRRSSRLMLSGQRVQGRIVKAGLAIQGLRQYEVAYVFKWVEYSVQFSDAAPLYAEGDIVVVAVDPQDPERMTIVPQHK